MKVTEVTMQDGRLCAQLINLLKAGRWELSGPDITAHGETMKWVSQLAGQMSEQLKAAKSGTNSGFSVKQMGTLPATSKKTRSKAK